MTNNWKPATAGILTILCGSGAIIISLSLLLVAALMPENSAGEELILNAASLIAPGISITIYVAYYIVYYFIGDTVQYFYQIVSVPFALLGILAITGGIFAIQRRRWGWAIAGSIGALLCNFIPGLIAVVLTAISKKEFNKSGGNS